jgi:hypothetical protein
VFPENFSFKQLEAIIDGKMRDKSRVLIECESTPVDYVTDTWSPDGHYVGNQIKLDTSNNITLFRSDKETINDLKAQLFALANKFAGDEYGHVAVQLHQIHNSIND